MIPKSTLIFQIFFNKAYGSRTLHLILHFRSGSRLTTTRKTKYLYFQWDRLIKIWECPNNPAFILICSHNLQLRETLPLSEIQLKITQFARVQIGVSNLRCARHLLQLSILFSSRIIVPRTRPLPLNIPIFVILTNFALHYLFNVRGHPVKLRGYWVLHRKFCKLFAS